MRASGYYIFVNGTKIWLDSESVQHGELHLEEGSMSEQCDRCAGDIVENGNLKRTSSHRRIVVCSRCDTAYAVHRVEGSHHVVVRG